MRRCDEICGSHLGACQVIGVGCKRNHSRWVGKILASILAFEFGPCKSQWVEKDEFLHQES